MAIDGEGADAASHIAEVQYRDTGNRGQPRAKGFTQPVGGAHAEVQALAQAGADAKGATAYVTGPPCSSCMRRLLQVGVGRIVYGDRQSACVDQNEKDACRIMAEALEVEIKIMEWPLTQGAYED